MNRSPNGKRGPARPAVPSGPLGRKAASDAPLLGRAPARPCPAPVSSERGPRARTPRRNRLMHGEPGRKRPGLGAASLLLLVHTMFASATLPCSAQDSVLDRNDINVAHTELARLIADVEGSIASAASALNDVRNQPPEGERREKVEPYFLDLEAKFKGMLNGLGPNSVLIDNLEGAKTRVIVLIKWFERQPATYPNRDRQISRLEETVNEYGALYDMIEERRADAQDAWRQLARLSFERQMARYVTEAELSVEFTKGVVEKLEILSEQIGDMAHREDRNDDSVPQ